MVERKFSGPITAEPPAGPGSTTMEPCTWCSPQPHSPPAPVIFLGSGPRALPLGQKLSILSIGIFPGSGKGMLPVQISRPLDVFIQAEVGHRDLHFNQLLWWLIGHT